MKAAEIKVGGIYWASVSGKKVKVRVDGIHQRRGAYLSGRRLKAQTQYTVTDLSTNRTLVFRSAMHFLRAAPDESDSRGDGTTDSTASLPHPLP